MKQPRLILQRMIRTFCLSLSLSIPSLGLIQKFFGSSGSIAYSMLVFLTVGIAVCAYGSQKIKNIFERYFWGLAVLTFISLIIIFAIMYPIETAGKLGGIGSDRDEALNIAGNRLLRGLYPYSDVTPLGNAISPMPGALILALPFVIIGNSAYQNFFWLSVFLITGRLYLKDRTASLLMLWLAIGLSPAVQYEFISGGDILANSLYILVFMFLLVNWIPRSEINVWKKLGIAVLMGIGLSSRLNFILLLPLIFSSLVNRAGIRIAIKYIGIACLSFGAVSLPLYLINPAGFTPLLTQSTTRLKFDAIPHAGILIALGTGLLSVSLAILSKNRSHASLFLSCAVVQAFPLVCAVVISSVQSGFPNFVYLHDRYGIMFLFFALSGFLWKLLNDPPVDKPLASA